MAQDSSHALRPPSAIDLAARCAALVLPRGWHAFVDQARLDARSVLDAVRGRHPPPFFDRDHRLRAPTPLLAIDPFEEILPKALARRYRTVRRDLRSVSDGLRGKHPQPFSVPHPKRAHLAIAPGASLRAEWTQVRVTRVERHGSFAATLHLETPDGAFPGFLPGQFVTVRAHLKGALHQRAYSICSTPADLPHIAITVKRVPGGTVSGYLVEGVEPGNVLRLRGPSGSFTCVPRAGERRHVILFAAGSGITPMMAILRAVLPEEPMSRASLFFGNRSEDAILFRDELDRMLERYPERLDLKHVLSSPSPAWTGRRGRIDASVANALLDGLGACDLGTATCMLCGPEGMMDAVSAVLLERGVPAARIQRERFLSPRTGADASRIPNSAQRVSLHDGLADHVFSVAPGRTLLQAGLDAGLPMKFSCAMGGCATCRVKVRRGSVYMPEPNALTPQERAEGYALACISHPLEAVEVEPG